MQRVAQRAHLIGELARKEVLDARAIALGVVVMVVVAVTIGNAVFVFLPAEVLEAGRRIVWTAIATVALIPVIAECFGGEGRTGGTRWAQALPVSATNVFVARVLVVAAFAAVALTAACVTDLVSSHAFHGMDARKHLRVTPDQMAAFRDGFWGAAVLALVSVLATAIFLRHSAVAAILGFAALGWCAIAFLLDYTLDTDGVLQAPLLWTRLIVVPLSGSGLAIAGCAVAAGSVFSIRGRRERSPARRGVALVVGAFAVATVTFASASDPLARDADALYNSPGTTLLHAAASANGEALVVTLIHSAGTQPRITVWVVDARTGERERIVAPESAGLGALSTLINVSWAHWRWEDAVVDAKYGEWGSVTTLDPSALVARGVGRLAFDLRSRETEQLSAVGSVAVASGDSWTSAILDISDDGIVHERWTRVDPAGCVEIFRLNRRVSHFDIPAEFGGPPVSRVFYADAEGRVRHLDLDAGTDVETGVVLSSTLTNVMPDPRGSRWLVVRHRDGERGLFDRTTGSTQAFRRLHGHVWTKRRSPLLTHEFGTGLGRDSGWTLMGVGEPQTIHFERPVDRVEDLDGERWIGMGRDPGTLYIFDAEGHVLRDLSPGEGQ